MKQIKSDYQKWENKQRIADKIVVVLITLFCLVVIFGVIVYVGGFVNHIYTPR